ncbi:hypothetical protein [Clostridium sp. YIM B02551]|uniref:hypothetical protein n=1 Tax=Clostridium sp. YIM B02551 TaxID=2910679 RepID=UPI001EEA4F1C|nr:hypothetical protein [Clostridium sp. YIM B02551]
MRISGTMSFIFKLILSLVVIFSAMGMEVVLKTPTLYLIISAIIIILAIAELIFMLRNNKNIFSILNIVSVIFVVISFFIIRKYNLLDYKEHKELLNKSSTFMMFSILALVNIIFGIANIIIGFSKKI